MSTPVVDSTLSDRISAKGDWVRKAAHFADGKLEQPEAGRYHLYVSLACPWACGTLTALHIKGLQDVIGHSVVAPTWALTKPDDKDDGHAGWWFRAPGDPAIPNMLGHGSFDNDDACVPDTVNGFNTIRELYEASGAPKGTTYSTPVLWDKKTKSIVNNESTKILRILNDQFNAYAKHPEVNLYPEEVADQAEEWHKDLYANVMNGVYRAGFARKQEAYDNAVTGIFASLEKAEAALAKTRFLTGSQLTWVDLRFYHNLVRFDPVYTTYFHANEKRIQDHPNLLGYIRDIYQSFPAFADTTNIRHIKQHYYSSHPIYNTFGIIPKSNGPALDFSPHGREHLK